jgi:hypothetical protein
VVFTLSSRMDSEEHRRVGKTVSVGSEWSSRDLGLKSLNPCESGCHQLSRSEAGGITFKNCPACIREWIMS